MTIQADKFDLIYPAQPSVQAQPDPTPVQTFAAIGLRRATEALLVKMTMDLATAAQEVSDEDT